jgi:UDPglucose 6-dehydrogenase
MKQQMPDLQLATSAAEAAAGADAILLVTEWPEFAHQNFEQLRKAMRTAVFFDGRRLLVAKGLAQQGWNYQTIGKMPESLA